MNYLCCCWSTKPAEMQDAAASSEPVDQAEPIEMPRAAGADNQQEVGVLNAARFAEEVQVVERQNDSRAATDEGIEDIGALSLRATGIADDMQVVETQNDTRVAMDERSKETNVEGKQHEVPRAAGIAGELSFAEGEISPVVLRREKAHKDANVVEKQQEVARVAGIVDEMNDAEHDRSQVAPREKALKDASGKEKQREIGVLKVTRFADVVKVAQSEKTTVGVPKTTIAMRVAESSIVNKDDGKKRAVGVKDNEHVGVPKAGASNASEVKVTEKGQNPTVVKDDREKQAAGLSDKLLEELKAKAMAREAKVAGKEANLSVANDNVTGVSNAKENQRESKSVGVPTKAATIADEVKVAGPKFTQHEGNRGTSVKENNEGTLKATPPARKFAETEKFTRATPLVEESDEDEYTSDDDEEDEIKELEQNPMKSAYWRQRLKHNSLLSKDELESEDEDSDSQPGGLDNADSYFNRTLLGHINQLRVDYKNPLKSLAFSAELSQLAKITWEKRADIPDGFGVIPECQISEVYYRKDKPDLGLTKFYDCLSYYDIFVHTKKDLPAATAFFWRNKASYSPVAGKYMWSGLEEIPYPRAETKAGEQVHGYKSMVRKVLLEETNEHMGVYFKKGSPMFRGGRRPYCVVAVFADSDSLEAWRSRDKK